MILLDTHVVVWLAFSQSEMSKKAKMAVDEARKKAEGLAISGITLFELAILVAKSRIVLEISLESFLREVESRFVVVPITAQICARAMELPAGYPKDPADRIIGATALVQGIPLLSADRAIRRSKALRTIW